MISAPGAVLVAVDVRTVVRPGQHHETDAERRGVPLVAPPGVVEDVVDRLPHGRSARAAAPRRIRRTSGRSIRPVPRPDRAGRPRRGGRRRTSWPGPTGVRSRTGRRRRSTRPPPRRTGPGRVPAAISATVGRSVAPEPETEYFGPLRRQVAGVPLLAGVFLRHLQFDGQPGVRHGRDHRRDRFADLEIHWSELHLQYDVVVETAVQRCEMVVGGACPVGGAVPPVLSMVVDEGPPEDRAAERSE